MTTDLEKQFFSVFDIEDVVLNDKKCSQPAPFFGWVRVVGQNKINITNVRTEQQHFVKGYNKRVYAFLPVKKGDKVHIEGNFLWGKFYGMVLGQPMTTELEKQFFDTFGIEPAEEKYCYWECKKPELENIACNNTECEHYRHKIHYPQITDRIVLELICIDYTENPYKCRGYISNAQELKNYLLGQFIHEFENDLYRDKEDIKHQVQALFKE